MQSLTKPKVVGRSERFMIIYLASNLTLMSLMDLAVSTQTYSYNDQFYWIIVKKSKMQHLIAYWTNYRDTPQSDFWFNDS